MVYGVNLSPFGDISKSSSKYHPCHSEGKSIFPPPVFLWQELEHFPACLYTGFYEGWGDVLGRHLYAYNVYYVKLSIDEL